VLAFQARRERRSEGRRRIADIAATADLPYLCLLFVAKVFIDTNVLFPFNDGKRKTRRHLGSR